jgi:hypothetical protein
MITMTRIAISPSGFRFGAGLPDGLDRLNPGPALYVELVAIYALAVLFICSTSFRRISTAKTRAALG